MDKSIKIGALSFVATVFVLALPSLAGAQEAGDAAAWLESPAAQAPQAAPHRDYNLHPSNVIPA